MIFRLLMTSMVRYFSILLFFVCFFCSHSYSQDLIVTNVGDSISCKIVLHTKDYVHFAYTKYNQNTVRVLTMDRIKSVIPGFYTERDAMRMVTPDTASIAADTVILPEKDSPDPKISSQKDTVHVHKTIQPKWRFGVNGGYAYRLFRPKLKSTPYELKYIEELKSGYSIGADVFYFPWDRVGFGLKYDVYKSKGERDIRTKDDITIQFIGASVAHRKFFENQKTAIISAFWMGYQPYRNVTRFIGQDYTMNASTMGWGVSVGIDHKIAKRLALSLEASCFLGSIYKFKKQNEGQTEIIKLSKDSFEDLSRAEITIGLKLLQ